MKITKQQLKKIIKEEINRVLIEREGVTPESMIAQYKEDQRSWQRVRNEFYNMAEGSDEYGIRPQYYPDWTNQDFIDVITAVEGSYEEY